MANKTFDTVKIQFEKFLFSIGSILTCEKEVNIIQNKLRRHFNTAASDYLCSNEFQSSLKHIQNIFVEQNTSAKYFTLLASFDEQLKKHSIKLSKDVTISKVGTDAPVRIIWNGSPVQMRPNLPSNEVSTISSITTTTVKFNLTNENTEQILLSKSTESTIEFIPTITVIQEVIEYLLDQCCNIVSELNVSKSPHTDKVKLVTTDSNHGFKHQRKIIKLERRLSRLSRVIRELEEKDMSLDEMVHCDLYVVESNLKKQACEMHSKLAKLKSQSMSIERIIHQPIILKASEIGHPLVNEDLQNMVNQSKHFPSFNDVLETVEKANEKHKLNLNDESRKKFAEKSFKIIGKEIKNRRMADFHDIMYSRLPVDFNIEQNDPALDSVEIEKVLLENEREANIKTEKIFEEFSQIEPDPENEISIELTDEEASENESDEQPEVEIAVDLQEMKSDTIEIIQPASPDPPISIIPESDPIESATEISLNDRTFTILSTASLPIRRSRHDIQSSPSSSSVISKESEVQTLTPRRRQNLTDNEIIYRLYKDRLTNNGSDDVVRKRVLTKNTDYSNVKKQKQQVPELIILD
ncbi:unnamed protein product [Adineta steineri]|uniref:Daxx histone-binding domain-containing protein n=1 Tax=Adineta steineri TaxID=433720 RepID=A0A815D4C5_9BILA|nr:unnamed protein product [Adineta steineri]CAF3565076.1 unnamed protein product [Adineta steineri]